MNAMWVELKAIFDRLSIDPAVRAILLTGAGEKAFSAGLDVEAATSSGPLSKIGGKDPARAATALRRHILEFQDCVSSIEKCEKPVIIVLHGYSLGLAIDICTAADIRLCASNTRFAVKEVDNGLAADIGTLSRLPKIVSSFSWVKDVCLSARPFGADEALRVGFISGVYGNKDEAVKEGLKLAASIAGKSPVAVQGTKELLNWSRDHTVADGLRYTSVWNSGALQSKDLSSAMLSALQRRTPTFEKL
ncbi:hypothetical protein FGG08_004468 [Glutinoglossum americanum]|uniref:Uncharacterized protein n=1 Tax=Glutinoglossum americanum TaxID=1670608 RepID=A0A9P8HWC2_9PEZI|nr:hypothetical protein FGG08_004468 [Glutinoglossum americanum]